MDLRKLYGIDPVLPASGSSEDADKAAEQYAHMPMDLLEKLIKKRNKEMQKAAGDLEFEKAAQIRDELKGARAAMLLRSNPPAGGDPQA